MPDEASVTPALLTRLMRSENGGSVTRTMLALADAPLRYEVDYLLGADQPYEPMVPLMWCLVAYLACDSLYRPPEWDVRAHHAESLVGLALGGYNVGVLNNCVLI